MMRPINTLSANRDRGSVLLLVILVTGLLTTVVASFHAGMEDTLDVTRNETGSLTAEFAAESGLEYAQRRIMIDPNWTGTGSAGILLPDGKTRFFVQAHHDADYVFEEDEDEEDEEEEDEEEEEEGEDCEDDCEEEGSDHEDCHDDDEDEDEDEDCDDEDEDEGDGNGCHSGCICCGGIGDCPYDCDERHNHRNDICDDEDDLDGDDEDDCGYHGEEEEDEEDEEEDEEDEEDDEDEDDDENEGDGNGCHSGCICCGGVGDCSYGCDERHNHRDDICDDQDDLDGDDEDDCGYHGEDEDEDEEEDECEDCEEEDGDCEDCNDDEDEDCDDDCGCKDPNNQSHDVNFVHTLEITGIRGNAKAQLSGEINVAVGDGGRGDLALLFLGDDFEMDGGIIYGDALITDLSNRASDWNVQDEDYSEDFSNHKGNIEFTGAGVDGTVFHYNDSDVIQNLGEEVVITAKAKTPAYSLDGFAEQGDGKVHFENTTQLVGLYLDSTAVVELEAGQHLIIDGCTLNGGLVVLVPDGADLREGARNTVELRNLNSIGGGEGGAEQNVGILAPGCAIDIQAAGNEIIGFTYVNEIDAALQSTFTGQLVVLNHARNMIDCTITFDDDIAGNLPGSISLEGARGETDLLSVFEDY